MYCLIYQSLKSTLYLDIQTIITIIQYRYATFRSILNLDTKIYNFKFYSIPKYPAQYIQFNPSILHYN